VASKRLIVVEGHGEDGAAPNLVNRLWRDLALPGEVVWDSRPIRCPKLYSPSGVASLCEILRTKASCDRVLVLRDDEDGCPRDSGPLLGAWVRAAALPFPVAIVLTYREYETLFLASLPSLAGKPIIDPGGRKRAGIAEGAVYEGDPQAKRDAKKAVSSFMPPTQPYKPTTDQLALTRHLDFGLLRASGAACFATLERALRFLASAGPGEVYPPAPPLRAP
jgi:hypothetical protein